MGIGETRELLKQAHDAYQAEIDAYMVQKLREYFRLSGKARGKTQL